MSVTQWLQNLVAFKQRDVATCLKPGSLRSTLLQVEPLEERRVFSVTASINPVGNVLEIVLDDEGGTITEETATIRIQDHDLNSGTADRLVIYDRTGNPLAETFGLDEFDSINVEESFNGGSFDTTVIFDSSVTLDLTGTLTSNSQRIETFEFNGDISAQEIFILGNGSFSLGAGASLSGEDQVYITTENSITLEAGTSLTSNGAVFLTANFGAMPVAIDMDATASIDAGDSITISTGSGSVSLGQLTAVNQISLGTNGDSPVTFDGKVKLTGSDDVFFSVNASGADVYLNGGLEIANATGGYVEFQLEPLDFSSLGTLHIGSDLTLSSAVGPVQVAGNLTFENGFAFNQVQLTGSSPGGNYDTVSSGFLILQSALAPDRTVNLNDAVLTFGRDPGYLAVVGSNFNLIELEGSSTLIIQNQFSSRANGDEFYSDGVRYQYSQAGGDGNDIALTILSPTTVWVDDDFAALSNGDDPAGPAAIFGYDAFANVQGGVTQVADTGLVNVAAHATSYNEEVVVTGKSLTLRGEGAGTTTIFSSTGTAFSASNAAAITLEELTFSGVNSLDLSAVDTTTLQNITTTGPATITGTQLILISDGASNDVFTINDSGISSSGLLIFDQLDFTVDTLEVHAGDGDDQIFVRPQPSTTILIDGGDGVDTLEADFYGLYEFANTPDGMIAGAGELTAADRENVTYASIETYSTLVEPNAVIVPQNPDDNIADNWLVKRSDSDPSILEVYVNGVLAFQQDYASTNSLTINGSGDNDTLVIDLSNGEINLAGGLHFNGGAGDDAIELHGSQTFTKVTHTFVSESDGSIEIIGNGTTSISYTGLEPIVDNLSATTREFIFTGGNEAISLTDDAAAGYNLIDSSLGESVQFLNPTDTLIITVQNGTDTFTASSLDALFKANIFVTMEDADSAGGDSLFWNAHTTIGFGSVAGTFELIVDSGTIAVNADIDNTAGGGSIRLEASDGVTQQGSLTTASDITISSTGGAVTTELLEATDAASEITITGTSVTLAGDVTSGNRVDITASTGAINQTSGTFTTLTLNLDAATGIGTTGVVNTSASTITATTGTSGIQLENAATAATTATLTATTGDILFNQTGGQSLTLTNVATSGNANLTNDAALTLNSALISGSGELTLEGTQVILGGNITASGKATITATDTITQTAGILTSPILVLDAQNGIGLSADAMEISTSDITATTATVGVFLANASNVTTGAVTATNLQATTSGNISFVQTGGQSLSVTNVSTTSGNATISNAGDLSVATASILGTNGQLSLTTTADGNLSLGTATTDGNLLVTSAGTFTQTENTTVGGLLDVEAVNAIDIQGTQGITGTSSITSSGSTVRLRQALTSGGAVTLEGTSGVTLDATGDVTSTGGSITITGTSVTLAGDVTSGSLVDITATTGYIEQTGGLVTSPTLVLDAQTGIFGTTAMVARAMEITASTITATTNTGGINLANLSTVTTGAVTATLTATSGNIQFVQTGGQNLTITSADTNDGDIVISNTGADLTVTTAEALGADGDITLSTITSGNLLLGTADATGDLNVTSAGTLNVTGNIGATNGPASTVLTATGLINAAGTVQSGGTLTVESTGGDVQFVQAVTAGGQVQLTAAQELRLDNLLTVTAGGASLTGATVILDNATIVQLNGTGDDLSISGALTTGANLFTTGGDITITGSTTLTEEIIVGSTGGNILFNGPVAGAGFDLSIDSAAGSLELGGAVTAVDDLILKGSSVTTLSLSAATLNGTTTAGPWGTTGDITITAAMELDVTGGLSITGNISAGSLQAVATGPSLFTGTITTTTGNVIVGTTTSGAIDFQDDVTSAANVTVTSQGAVDFGGHLVANSVTGTIEVIGASVDFADDVEAATSIDIKANTGAINQTGGTFTTLTLILDAATGIGTTGVVNTSAKTITATTNTGGINLANLSTVTTGAVTATLTATTSGNLQFVQTGGQILTITNADTNDGDIVISNTGADLTVTTAEALGADGDITLSTITSGNLQLGTADATGDLNVTSAGTYTQSGDVEAGGLIDVQSDGLLRTQGTVTAGTTISLESRNGGLEVQQAIDADGNIELQARDNILLTGSVTTASNISIKSMSGNISTVVLTASGATSEIHIDGVDITLGGNIDSGSLVSIIATGHINQTTGTITSPTLVLDSVSGVGTTSTIQIASANIDAKASSGRIFLANDSSAVTGGVTAVLQGNNEDIQFTQTGGQDLTVTSATTTVGNITLSNDSADLNADLTTTSVGGISLSTMTVGHITAGFINSSSAVSIISAQSVTTTNQIITDGTIVITAGTTTSDDIILGGNLRGPGGPFQPDSITLTAGGKIESTGTITTSGLLQADAGTSIDIDGQITANALDLTAGSNAADFIELGVVAVNTTTVLTSGGALRVLGNFNTGTTATLSSGDATFSGTYRSGNRTELTSTGDVLFAQTLNVDGGGMELLASGTTTFDAAVTVVGSALIGDSLGSGTIHAQGPVDVTGWLTINSQDDVRLDQMVDVGGDLEVHAGLDGAGDLVIGGDIGTTRTPTGITMTAGGLIDAAGSITTTGLSGNLFLTSGTTMTLSGPVNASAEVRLENGGLLSITDPAGITAAGRIMQAGTGDVSLHGNITSTSGEVNFAEDVVLTSDVVVTSGSSIVFQKTINGTTAGSEDLTLDAATTVTLGEAVGAVTRLGVLTIDGTTVTTAGITAAALDGETTSSGNWDTTGDVDITGLAKVIAAGSFTLTGNLTAGEVEATANGDLTITGTTSTSAGGDVTLTTLTTGDIEVGAIDADGDVRITSVGSYTQNGNVEAGGLIDIESAGLLLTVGALTAGTTLDLESTSDAIEIQQAVSAGGNITLIGSSQVRLGVNGDVAATNLGSTITVTGDLVTAGNLVTNSGAILINDNVTLRGDVLFDSNSSNSVGGGADITANGITGIDLDGFTLTIDAGFVGDFATGLVTGTSDSDFVITNAQDASIGTGNLTAGTVTVDLVGHFTNHGIATVHGLLDVDAGGHILFQQAIDAGSVDLEANEDVTLNGDVTAVTSVKVVANADGILTGGNVTTKGITTSGLTSTIELRGDAVDLGGDIEAGASVLVVATSGAITQLAGTTITTDDLGLFAAGDIGTGLQFFQTDVNQLAVRSTGGNVFLENAGDLEIGGATFESFTGASAENLTVNVVAGALDVSGNVNTTDDLTLEATSGITISGDLLSASGTIVIDADSDANANGLLSVTATGSVTATAEAIRITASDVTLAGSLTANGAGTSGPNNAPVGFVEIRQSTAAATIGLGSATGDLSLSAAELANVSTNQLIVGRTDGGNISIATVGSLSPHIGTLVLLTNGNVAGTVDGSPDVSVGQLAIVAGGQVTLDFNVTTLAVSAGNTATGHVLRDTAGGLTIGSIAEALGGTLVAGVQTGTGPTTIEALGGDAGDLIVNSPIVVGGNSLTLVADDDVTVNADVTLATGSLIIEADADGSGAGEITIASSADVAVTSGLATDSITLCAADLDLLGTVDVGLGTVELLTSTAAGTFGLGSGSGSYEVTQAELDQITANRLLVGSATKTNAGIELGDVSWIAAGKEARLTTDGAITQDAGSTLAITTPTLVLDAATGINLQVNADHLSARNRTSGDIVLVDTTGGLTIADDLVVGGLDNQAVAGAIDLRVTANTLTTLAGAQIVTNDGHIRLRADEYVLGAGINAGTETVLLQNDTAGRTISLNGAAAGINLSQAELQGIVAGSLEVGRADAGDVSVGDIDGLNVTTLAIITNGSIEQNLASVITVANLGMVAQTGINLTTRVDTLALRNGTSGSVTINQGNRALTLGEVNLKASTVTGTTQNGSGDLEITAANSVTITEEITSSGNVLLDAVGAISQQADIDAAGVAVTLASDATISMASGTNITAASASLTAAGDITLAEIVAGTIGITSTGGSIQDVNVSDSTVNLNAGAGSITLIAATGIGTTGGAAGTLELSGKTISATSTTGGMNLANASNVTTGAVTATNLQATTSGNISFLQTGGQSLSVTNVSTTSGNATISNAGDLSIATASILGTNGQLSLTTTASGNLSLGTATTDGNLLVTSAGTFTQTGSTTVGGLLDMEAVNAIDIQGTQGITGTSSITSSGSTVRLRQALTSGGAVTLEGTSGVTLDATGDVTSTGGSITIIGDLTTAGDLITDDQPIEVQGNMLLTGDVLFDSDSTNAGTGADVTVTGDIDLATFTLTIDAGPDGDFSVGDVTGTTGDLVIEEAHSLSFGSLTADTINIGPVTGDITIGLGGLTANSASFDLDGNFTNNGPTTVTNHLLVQAGGSIEFVGDLEAGSLELDAGTTIDLGNVTVDTTTILTSVGTLTVGGNFDTGTTSNISSGDATFTGSYRSGGRTEIASTGNVLFQSTLDIDADGLEIIAAGTTTFNQAVTVVGNAVIGNATSGTVHALAALDVAGDLTITTAADIDLDSTVDVGGNLLFDAGQNVNVAGATDVVGNATVTADDDIDFGSTLDVGGVLSLTAGTATTDDIRLAGNVGATRTPTSITLGAGGLIEALGTVTTSGLLEADAGTSIEVQGLLTANSLDLDAGTDLTLDDVSVTTSSLLRAGDAILVNGTFNTGSLDAVAGGTTTFNQAVTVVGNAVIGNATSGTVHALAALDVAGDLTITTAADIDLDGTVDVGGNLLFDAGQNVNVAGATDVVGNATVTADDDIDFGNTLDVGGVLSLTAGTATTDDIRLAGNVGATRTPTSITLAAGGLIDASGTVAAGGILTADAGTSLNFDQTLTTTGPGSNILLTSGTTMRLAGAVNSSGEVELDNGGLLSILDPAGITAVGRVVQIGTGDVSLHGDITSTSGEVNFAEDVVLTSDVVVTSGSTITFQKTINGTTAGAEDLTLDAVSDVTLGGSVGNTTRLGALVIEAAAVSTRALTVASLDGTSQTGNWITTGNIDATGVVLLDVAGNLEINGHLEADSLDAVADGTSLFAGTVDVANNAVIGAATSGAVTINDLVTVGGDLTVRSADDITMGDGLLSDGMDVTGAVVVNSVSGDLTVRGTTEAGSLDANAGNDILFDGSVTTVGGMVLTAGQDIDVTGAVDAGTTFSATATAGAISLDSTLTTGGAADLTSGTTTTVLGATSIDGNLEVLAGDTIRFAQTLDATGAVTLETGSDTTDEILLEGAVGGVSSPTSITLTSGGKVLASSSIKTSGLLEADAGTSIEVQGLLTANSLDLDAGTDLTLDDVSVTTSSLLRAGDAILVNGTFNTGSLDAVAGGTTTFNDAVTVTTGNAVIGNATSGTVHALAALDVSGDLKITTAADIDLDGTVDVGGNLLFDAGQNVNVAGATDVVGNATVTADDDIDFGNTLDVGGVLSLTAGTATTDDIRLAGNVGATRTPTSITLAAGGLIEALGTITTSGLLEADAGTSIEVQGLLTANSLDLDAGTDLTLDDVSVTTSSLIAAVGDLLVNGTYDVGTTSTITADDATFVGPYETDGRSELDLTGDFEAQSTFTVAGGGLELLADGTTTFVGVVEITGTAVIGELTSGTINAQETFTVTGGDLTLQSADDIDFDRALDVSGAIVATAGNDFLAQETIDAASLTIDATRDVLIDGAVETSGLVDVTAGRDVVFGDTLDAGTTLTVKATTGDVQFVGAVTAGGAVVVTATVGEIRVDDLLTVTDGFVLLEGSSVQLDNDTVIQLNGAGRGLTILGTLTTGADLFTNGGDILTGGGGMTLTDSITIETAGGDLEFNGTINGQTASTFDLTIDTDDGRVDFNNSVGDINAIRNLVISEAGDVLLTDVQADLLNIADSSGTVTFVGDVITTAANGLDVTAEAIVMLAGSSLNSTGQDVVLTANDIDLNGDGITATGATVFLQTRNDATAIGLENSATAMNFTDIQLDKIITNKLVIGTTTNTGGITIGTDAPLTMNQPEVQLLTAGDVTVNGSLTVLGTGTLTVDAGDDVAIFGMLATTNGALLVNADDNITLGAAGRVLSTGGTITLAADADLSGAGSFTMTNGAIVESQTQLVTITAAGDVTVGQVISGRTGGLAIDLVSRNGAIIDGGDTGGSDLIANGAGAITRLDAATGIGSATGLASDAALETTVFEIQATNRTSGDIRIDETDALRLQDIDNQGPGAIAVQSVGTMTLLSGFDVTAASGLVSLLATGAAADLLLNGSVTTTTSSITLGAGRNVQFSGVTTIQTNGNIGITATNGTARMLNGSVVNAGSGTIAVTANGDVSISRLVTTNATTSAVQITSQTGGIRDSGESGGADIQADSAGALVTLRAATGIGSVSDGGADAPLELQVARLDAINSTSGDIRFSEATGLNIERLTQQGAGQIAGVVNGGTIITAAGQGISSQTGDISLTVNGTDADLTILNNVSTTGGNITMNVRGDVTTAANTTIASQGGNIAIAADSDLNNVGGIALADGSLIDAGAGTIVLSAAENIAVSRLVSTNAGGAAVSLTSRLGAITDAGDTGGVDIDAPTVVLRAATGIGSGNALETNIATLAARNTTSGGIQIDNTAGAGLNVATVDGLTGISNAGANGLVSLVSSGDVFINGAVLNTAGGTIQITSLTGDITLNQRLAATGGNGSISLDADQDINLNDSGSQPDVEVQGTGSVVGVAGGLVNFAPNVQVASQTGAVTDVPPLLINVQTPQVQADGSAQVSGTFGRPGEKNFIITVDWGDGTVETFYFDQPGNFLFKHTYNGNPDPNNPASPIPITVTIEQDPLIRFFEARVVEQNTTTVTSFASVPGEGLAGSIPFDLTPPVRPVPEPAQTRLDEALLSQSVALSQSDVLQDEGTAGEAVGDDEIQVIIQVLGADGEVLQSVALSESVLDDLPRIFKKLPDGQYKVVVREPGEPVERTVLEVELRQGRIVNEQEQDLDRPPRETGNPSGVNPEANMPGAGYHGAASESERMAQFLKEGQENQQTAQSPGYRSWRIQSRLDEALGAKSVEQETGQGPDALFEVKNSESSRDASLMRVLSLVTDVSDPLMREVNEAEIPLNQDFDLMEPREMVEIDTEIACMEENSGGSWITQVAIAGTIMLGGVAVTNSLTDKVSPLARGRRLMRRLSGRWLSSSREDAE
ncbi:hypothetical protein [Planctopirus hydrillae]|uniref:Uncharacterized protein n=1 Tax=Planctopirus hydrillae TaxID=1841610 RepID=A0A1C3E8P8_9PLAN|nr:hypothetical protein [Planctopirus hydrillae]ODA29613.1 hypothetical protein A6X21_08040 [Planctopirus hydrillae]